MRFGFRKRHPIEVELLTRPDCSLCEEMKEALKRASRGLELRLTEVDVTEDEELLGRFGNDVPVLRVNGRNAFKHRASEKELRKRLLRERS